MYKRDLPKLWEAGFYYECKFPDITKTNGTMKYIRDVLNNFGHNADRNNTMGIPYRDKVTGETKWRKSGSTTGATDMFNDIFVPGYPKAFSWKIEVKKGNDDLNKAQTKYRDKMNRVGVLHSVIRVGELEFFWDEYYKILKL